MNAPRLTDAQISQGLRAHLPGGAYPELRQRVLEAAGTTGQQRALPSFLGALSDADPVARRQSYLIAAALLVALALAGVAGVGAWRILQRDPIQDLNLERPADIPAFVLSSRDRMLQLPPVAITTLGSDATMDRIYVDRSGAVRLEQYASVDATEPARTTILNGTTVGETQPVGTNTVWLVNDQAIADDPRLFILSLSGLGSSEGPGCATSPDPSEAGSTTSAAGWRYVGAETVAGRPAHHLTCVGGDLWIDDETRLILRVRQPDLNDAGDPVPGAPRTPEVTQIEFGEQPAGLFALTPPNGVAAMTSEEYSALCPGDTTAFQERPCSGTPRSAEVAPKLEPSPTPTERPSPDDCAIPSGDSNKPTGPLAWTQASLEQDWPAPVRLEPVGGSSVVPMPPTYIDPAGDTGSAVLPCVDIRDLRVGTYLVSVELVSNRPPDVDPSKAWIAYGVVVDVDRDGVPDWRYGIDNLPRTPGDEAGHHREWRTDLHTGRTEWAADPDWANVSETYLATGYPAEAWGGVTDDRRFPGHDARFYFGNVSDTTQGTNTRGVKVDFPFYTWASAIVDGRVVAADYAPDTGWIVPSPGATPGGTYVQGVGPLRLSMTVPTGWANDYGWMADGTAPDDDGAIGLEFLTIDEPPKTNCDGSGGTPEVDVGPSVDDLVRYLEGLQAKSNTKKSDVVLKISENTDVTVDGYRGRYLEYTTTTNADRCGLPVWPASTHQNDNHDFTQAWILDVDGVRLVIDAFAPKASETSKAEFEHIVESIDNGP